MSKNVKVAPAPEDGQQQEPNAEMTEEQHKRAKHHWSHVRAEVKLGIIGKAMKNKKENCCCFDCKNCHYSSNRYRCYFCCSGRWLPTKTRTSCARMGTLAFCPKPEPVANKEASKAFFRADICHTTKKDESSPGADWTLCPKLDK